MKKKEFAFIETLSSEQRAKLKGLAHHLKPLVQVGVQGFSDTVQKEIVLALDKHELIKVQLPSDTNATVKGEKQNELIALLPKHAHVVSRIGRTVILYLQKEPHEQKVKL
ncbi:MAG: YhbY family RNA-binding protein [Bdellovibrionota bacterium]